MIKMSDQKSPKIKKRFGHRLKDGEDSFCEISIAIECGEFRRARKLICEFGNQIQESCFVQLYETTCELENLMQGKDWDLERFEDIFQQWTILYCDMLNERELD